MTTPIFSVCCIDYRYDAMTTNFFEAIGLERNYFLNTTAGGALSLGYKHYCNNLCKSKSCSPNNSDMKLLKKTVVKNLQIALTLQPITEVYLLNHQNCGAIIAYLPCSGYPYELGKNNKLEIEINANLLTFAQSYIHKTFPNIKKIRLGLIDANGTVKNYDPKTKLWTLAYTGQGNDPKALWYRV